ncbi:MAG: regulatory iron-sulfur-containing complex subunit RicT, partial [Oscillospiraceae bacterium]|nr:regulatory iron-sulfur-containing complex subunit RicT [Oscillospiraceae bacterium]
MQEQNPDTVLEQQTAASEPEAAAQQPAADTQQPAEAAAPAKEEAPAQPAEPAAVTVVDIRFRNNAKSYYFDPAGLTLQAGAHVIIDTARGDEFGVCAAGNHPVKPRELVLPLRRVLRVATQQDERANAENQEKEKKAFEICQQKIAAHGLEMQLVSAECAFDGSKLLFFFTADGRVDFRELVKDLASVFRTRIELRQIGVRDEAKMLGGLGICGRPFCCSSFLSGFQPVSIKMAK